jgi:hypothetical protein
VLPSSSLFTADSAAAAAAAKILPIKAGTSMEENQPQKEHKMAAPIPVKSLCPLTALPRQNREL